MTAINKIMIFLFSFLIVLLLSLAVYYSKIMYYYDENISLADFYVSFHNKKILEDALENGESIELNDMIYKKENGKIIILREE